MHSFLGHESADVEVVEFELAYEEWLEAFTTPRRGLVGHVGRQGSQEMIGTS